MTKLVVIGGDAGGMSAAARANRGAESVEVVVFERGRYTSYSACGLPYLVGGLVPEADNLVARSPEAHRANGIDVRMGHEVTAIDTAEHFVEVHDRDSDTTFRESYDHLLIATGATPIRPPLTNIDAKGITGIHTIPDALTIDEIIRTRIPQRAVVVGGGYIGLEMVEALVARGLHVTLVEKLEAPMATLDPDMGARVADGIRHLGADVQLGVGVEGFELDAQGWVAAVATETGELPADLVVMGLGVRANVALAAQAGIAIGPSGAIATDARMSTRTDGVWAAGDCVESFHRVSQKPVSIALGTHANKQGRVVGMNISGTPARFPGVIGTAVTKVGQVEIGRTGLNQREAAEAGFDAVARPIEGNTRSGYYPDSAKLVVKVVAERTTGRMLGAQIVGGAEAAKRIDALAVAVWNEMTVEAFSQLDLGYAPPYSPVWDTPLIAARLTGEAAQKTSSAS